MSGRMGGIPDEDKDKVVKEIIQYQRQLGISDDDIDKSLAYIYLTTEHDYRLLCTGGSRVPQDLPQEFSSDWHAIRNGGLSEIARPDTIEAFFERAGMMNEKRQGLLEDYRYYIEHRRHRRPEIWAKRNELFR